MTDYFSPYFYQGSETAEVFSRLTVVADFHLTRRVVAIVVVVVSVVAAVSVSERVACYCDNKI